MDYSNKILNFKKKTISRLELYTLYGFRDDDLYPILKELLEKGLIKAISSSQTNGNIKFPIYNKYKIIKNENTEIDTAEIERLHPKLLKNEWLKKNPNYFLKYKSNLNRLSKYFYNRKDNSISISRKEKSFEIFGEEKELDNKNFTNFLLKLDIDNKILNFYDTPEHCFSDFIPEKKKELTLLICENKDIWFNIRRMMFEENKFTIINTKFDGVVYGQGNVITESKKLEEYIKFLKSESIHFYYWGDLDIAGIEIFLRLKKSYPELEIKLFINAYKIMINLSKAITIPKSDDKRGLKIELEEFKSLFNDDEQFTVDKILKERLRLPQEIINFAYLNKNMRG